MAATRRMIVRGAGFSNHGIAPVEAVQALRQETMFVAPSGQHGQESCLTPAGIELAQCASGISLANALATGGAHRICTAITAYVNWRKNRRTMGATIGLRGTYCQRPVSFRDAGLS